MCRVGRRGRVREGDCLNVSSIVDSPHDQFLSGPDAAHTCGPDRCLPLPLGSTHGQGCLKLSAEGADSSVSAKLIILYRTGGGQQRAGPKIFLIKFS